MEGNQMGKSNHYWNKNALFSVMAEKAPKDSLDQNTLMEYAYLLQTLFKVPLGYNFTLYGYGLQDFRLLDDLNYAKKLGAVDITKVYTETSYWKKISVGDKSGKYKELASDFLSEYENYIERVLKDFGGLNLTDLVLESIIVYADQWEPPNSQSQINLARCVRDVKPHLTLDEILSHVKFLHEKKLLQSLSEDTSLV